MNHSSKDPIFRTIRVRKRTASKKFFFKFKQVSEKSEDNVRLGYFSLGRISHLEFSNSFCIPAIKLQYGLQIRKLGINEKF